MPLRLAQTVRFKPYTWLSNEFCANTQTQMQVTEESTHPQKLCCNRRFKGAEEVTLLTLPPPPQRLSYPPHQAVLISPFT